MAVDGLLLADKPAGVTSHDVVSAARRALGERRIGHAGTLDPFATGLLVLLVGRATRLLPHMAGEPKVYRAVIRFGAETDTCDLAGETVATGPQPDRDAVAAAIASLTGPLDQVPPIYSAKRIGGKRAYDLARAGESVVLAPSRVVVHAWRDLTWEGDDLAAEIVCGGGTYVRSLARDLGRAVGSAAHLVALRRTAAGPFRVDDAVSLEQMRDGGVQLMPPLAALPDVPAQPLDADDVGRVARGIDVAATVPGERGALTNAANGALVALAERRGDRWQPRVVMRPAGEPDA